ncbi:MAG: hypothetical protein EBT93_07340, partial [Alphaproteobacteria bacterium]|nr:hypothetical protein [Alphaproteobacteria bacterium]
ETNAGNDVSNYSITAQGTTTANVTAKALTVNAQLTSASKVYDGNAIASVTNASLVGLISGENVTAIGSGTYDNKDVGTGKTITISYTLQDGSNGLASNYSISAQSTNNGTITKAPLTVVAVDSAKFTTSANPSYSYTYSGFKGSDTSADIDVAGTITRTNNSEAVGTYTDILVPAGFSDNNYSFVYENADLTIIPADALLVRLGNNTTTYGTSSTYAGAQVVYWDSNSNSEITNLTPTIAGEHITVKIFVWIGVSNI